MIPVGVDKLENTPRKVAGSFVMSAKSIPVVGPIASSVKPVSSGTATSPSAVTSAAITPPRRSP